MRGILEHEKLVRLEYTRLRRGAHNRRYIWAAFQVFALCDRVVAWEPRGAAGVRLQWGGGGAARSWSDD